MSTDELNGLMVLLLCCTAGMFQKSRSQRVAGDLWKVAISHTVVSPIICTMVSMVTSQVFFASDWIGSTSALEADSAQSLSFQ